MSEQSRDSRRRAILPSDHRFRQGGALFLISLLVFFLSSILLYAIYALRRSEDPQSSAPLPSSFLISTVCLLVISGLVQAATRTIRREKRKLTSLLLTISGMAAILFMRVQYDAMQQMLGGPALRGGTGKGVAGMVTVLALLHAAHVDAAVQAAVYQEPRPMPTYVSLPLHEGCMLILGQMPQSLLVQSRASVSVTCSKRGTSGCRGER